MSFKGTHFVLYHYVYLKKESIQHSSHVTKKLQSKLFYPCWVINFAVSVNIFNLVVLISPFSISTGKTSIFSTLFSNSYSADAETGSTSSLRRSYSSLEKVLKTCGDQRYSFSTTVFALRMKLITNITDGRSYIEDLHRCQHIYHHGRPV